MRGDHVYCVRRRIGVGVYTHHGIDLGDGHVIHYTGEPGQKAHARIAITTIEEFAAGDAIEIEEYGRCDEPEIVISRAMKVLGQRSYKLLTNNCEHFARWCKTGKATSKQVRDKSGKTATAATGAVGATAAIGTVAVGGSVAGLSGAGVMTGLAAVGGSAVGGLVALGAAPGAVGTLILNNTVFKHDEHASCEEQAACQAARWGTRTGTVAGGAAAIGATVGGGMVAGTAVIVAAPLAGAAAVGAAVYGLARLLRRRR